MNRPAGLRLLRHTSLVVCMLGVVALLAAALVALAPAPAAGALARVAANQQAALSNLLLHNLGSKTSSISSLAWDGSALSKHEIWRSSRGGFDSSNARFVVADFNGDGRPDALTLRPVGAQGARIDLFISDGVALTRSTPWKSANAGFRAGLAKLGAGDVNGDGRAELLVLAPYGRAGAQIISFSFGASRVTRTALWRTSASLFVPSSAQLACADLNGDARDDGIVLGRNGTGAVLQGLLSSGAKLTSRYVWRGALPAGSQLAAGATRGTSRAEALVLRPISTSRAIFDRFAGSGRTFARSRVWTGSLAAGGARAACTDLNADGKSDVLALTRNGSGSLVKVFLSRGTSLRAYSGWSGGTAAYRLRLAAAAALPAVLSPRSEVLTPAETDTLAGVSADQSTLSFTGGAPQGVAVGDVLVIGTCEAAPDGLLRKVTGIQSENGMTTVTTTEAALQDAAESLDLNYEADVTSDDLGAASYIRKGVRLVRPEGKQAGRDINLSWQIDDLNVAGLTVDGEITLQQSFNFRIKIDWFRLKLARFTTTLTQTSSFTLSKTGTWNILDERVTIASYHFKKPIVVMVGALPVTIHPVLEIYLSASGEIEAGIRTTVGEVAAVTLGAEYVPGRAGADFRAIEDHSLSGSFDPPHLVATAWVEGAAGVSLATLIYGLAGPEAFLEGYTNLTLDSDAAHWWSVHAGIRAGVGFVFPALDFEWRWSPLDPLFDWELAHSDDPAPAPRAGLSVRRTVAEPSFDAPGDVLHYTLTATNTGNQLLTGVTLAGAPALDNVIYTNGDGIPVVPPVVLFPEQRLVLTGTRTVTQADLDAGAVADTATADSDQTAPATAQSSVPAVQTPELSVTASAAEGFYDSLGDLLNYTVTATNTGNVTLTGVTIATDPALQNVAFALGGGAPVTPPVALPPGQSLVLTGTHLVTQADIGAGSFRADATAGSAQTTPVGAEATVAYRNPVFPVCTLGSSVQSSPAISGNYVVWTDDRDGDLNIYGKNVTTDEEFPVCISPGDQYAPAISGNFVVWVDDRNDDGTNSLATDIYARDLSAGVVFPVAGGPGYQSGPAISGDRVVWVDNATGYKDIYTCRLTGGEPYTTPPVQLDVMGGEEVEPAVSGDIVVWITRPLGIYAYDVGEGAGSIVVPEIVGRSLVTLAMSGTRLVWEEQCYPALESDVAGLELADLSPLSVQAAVGVHESAPAISGDTVVWQEALAGGPADICGYDLLTSTRFPIATGAADQSQPAIDGSTVVWQSDGDIYGAHLEP